MATTETTQDIHPDAIICPECGHDCDGISDCGDICICEEEVAESSFDDELDFLDDFDWRIEYSDGYDD